MTAPVIDLSYDAPPPPVDLADRARVLGRRRLRARRATTASGATAAVVAAALSLVVTDLSWTHGAAVVGGDGTPRLPMNRGEGPTAAELAAPGVTRAGARSLLERKPVQGHPVVVGEASDGQSVVQYVTVDAFYCLGYRAPYAADDDVQPSVCMPLDDLPAEGLTLGTGFGAGAEAGHRRGAEFVTGIVRGPVDEVRIDGPEGSYAARLDQSDVPGVGTFYSAAVPGAVGGLADVRRTVLRGGEPVFGCVGYACITTQG